MVVAAAGTAGILGGDMLAIGILGIGILGIGIMGISILGIGILDIGILGGIVGTLPADKLIPPKKPAGSCAPGGKFPETKFSSKM